MRKFFRPAAAMVLLALISLVAAACAGVPTKVGSGGTVKGTPLKGGTVTVAEVGASPNLIFPYPPSTNSNGYNVNLTEGLWPNIVYAGNGAKAEVNPAESLFSSLKYSDNDTVVTIVLKPWKWSDGVPISSRDFTFVYNLLKVNYKNWLGYIQGQFPVDVTQVQTPDSHTIVLHLNQPYSPTYFTDNVLTELPLIPQHAWDKTSVDGKVGNFDTTKAGAKAVYSFLQKQGLQQSTFATNPLWKVVDGPWTLQSFNSNGFYAWVPNKNYSGPDKPKLSKVQWTPFTTDTAEMNTLRSGTSLDLANLPLNDVGQISQLEAEGYTVGQLPTAGVAEIVPNLYNPVNGPLLRNLYVRQVLELLFDRQQIVKKVYNGYADAGNGPIPLLYGSDFVTPLERSGGPYSYAPSKAVALLKAHGWKVVPNGVSTCEHPGTGANQCGPGVKAGEPMQFQLMYSSGSTSFDQQNASIQSTERAAGVKIVLDPVPFNTIVSTTGYCNAKSHPTSTCSWQLQDYGYNPYTLDPTGSGQFNTGGYGNYGGYSNPQENKLINATVHSSSSSAFKAYEDFTAQQLPYLWLPIENGLYVYKKNLAGITPWNPFSGTLNPELWYYVKPGK